MRARLNAMQTDQQYTFLCVPYMAERMEDVVPDAGGEITMLEKRNYGMVLTVRKC